MTSPPPTTLRRPTDPRKLEPDRALDRWSWPPRLAEQPASCPVLSKDHAIRIAHGWNLRHASAGFATLFDADSQTLRRYPARRTGNETRLERCMPTQELDQFHAHAPGHIKVAQELR